MALNFDKIIIDKVDLVSAFNRSTGALLAMLDEIKDGTLENGEEVVYATGSAGTRLSSLKRNKTAKFSCNNGFVIGGLITMQTGTDVEVASSATLVVPTFDILTCGETPTTVLTTETATGTVGAEIGFIYKANSDGTQGTSYAQAETASSTQFTYTAGTKTITLPTGGAFVEGDKVIVFYDYLSMGKKYVNSGDTFSNSSSKVVVDLTLRDVCDNATVYHGKIVMPNASVDGNFSFQFGNDPSVHAFACEALQDPCSTSNELWYLIIPEDAA